MNNLPLSPAFEAVLEAPAPRGRLVAAPSEWKAELTCAFESDKPATERTKGRLAEMTWRFAYADTVGVNRKVYPYEVVKGAVADCNAMAQAGQVFGRLDHPMEWDPNAMRSTMADASHRITSCAFESDNKTLVVKANVLESERGQQLMACFASGGNPGLSQRAGAYFVSATEDQKVTYKQPIDEPLDIAAVLRLVTFDVVSRPGFTDATDPVVLEHEEGATMTLDELKAKFPDLFKQVTDIGRAEGRKEAVTVALEAERPNIIAGAIKPLNDQIAALTAEKNELVAALESVKPTLVKFNLVNEKITDADAARQVGELTTKLGVVTNELSTLKAANEAVRVERDALVLTQKKAAIKGKVAETYKGHKFLDDILNACESANDEAQALELAARKVADITRYTGAAGGGLGGGSHLPNPGAGSGGGGAGNEKTRQAGAAVFAGRGA